MKSTVPVTISGFWYSSPIRFQYAVFANSRSYGSRSFSFLISVGSAQRLAPARSARRRRRRRVGRAAPRRRVRGLVLVLRDLDERHDVGVDDPQRRLRAQLAAQQPDRFLVGVDVVGAAGDEAGDQHALERRDVQLRLDRRLDRDLEVADGPQATRGRRAAPPARRARALRLVLSAALVRSLISLNSS